MIEESENLAPKRKDGNSERSIDTYAAQCERCRKWRKISTQEEYEEIRSKLQEDPFVCEKQEGKSCGDDEDVNYDATRTWVMDKPGLSITPKGFKRSLIMRKDYSRMDAYYITPTGRKLRTRKEISAFIESNEEYKDAPLDDFIFTVPEVMKNTVPCSVSSKSPKPSKKDN